ncbi:hypothetical protein NN561_004467 [Cricetulus griseus]
MLRMERVEVGIILRKGVGLYHPERLTGLGGGGARATQPGAGRPAFPWVATTDPVTAATVRDPDRRGAAPLGPPGPSRVRDLNSSPGLGPAPNAGARFCLVAGFAHDCRGSSWLQEVGGRTEPPPGAQSLPATLPSKGVGTRRAQESGPRLSPPLPVNYAGSWHRCSSCSSFPGNFRPGIPPPAQRAAPPALPEPQAPFLASQPWVLGFWEGSGRHRPRPRPCPLDWGLRGSQGATHVTSPGKLRFG